MTLSSERLSGETIVGEKLVEWLNNSTNVQILSFHPPSSKAYASDLIRIPKLDSKGHRSKSRNHIDLVFLTEDSIWLIELKTKYSESGDDLAKLQEIKDSYTNSQLITFIKNRITVPLRYNFDNVKYVVTAIGVKTLDIAYDGIMPVFVVDENVELLGAPIELLQS